MAFSLGKFKNNKNKTIYIIFKHVASKCHEVAKRSTPFTVFGIIYYSELHMAIIFLLLVKFVPSKHVNVL